MSLNLLINKATNVTDVFILFTADHLHQKGKEKNDRLHQNHLVFTLDG